ncbi:Putative Universal stress protein UspA (fragment) [Thiomonas sp. X19]
MLDSYYAEQSEAVLAPARASLQAAGLQLEARHRHGDAAAQIVKFVREHEIDLVMMGSHGHTALSGMALGSVTTKVIASSSIPVLIVR